MNFNELITLQIKARGAICCRRGVEAAQANGWRGVGHNEADRVCACQQSNSPRIPRVRTRELGCQQASSLKNSKISTQ